MTKKEMAIRIDELEDMLERHRRTIKNLAAFADGLIDRRDSAREKMTDILKGREQG